MKDSLKVLCPRLFRLSCKHDDKILSCVDTSIFPYNWKLGFRRNLNDLEVVEFATLMAKLESARFYLSWGDTRRWSLEKDGSFSCSSYKRFLCFNLDASVFHPVDQIWKVKVPSKVHILAWSVAHGKVNTCNNIQKRRPLHYLNPQWCILCKAEKESVDHLFLQCFFSIQMWWRLFKKFGLIKLGYP